MAMAANITKKQHYVPRFYLRNFTDENGLLHVYDREKQKIFCAPPEKILYEKMLYETRWEGASEQLGDYVLKNELEHSLGERESRYGALINHVLEKCNRANPFETIICSEGNKDCLADCIVNLYLRNPRTFFDIQNEYADSSALDICQAAESLFTALNLGSPHSLIKHSIKQGILDPAIPGGPAYVEKRSLLKMNVVFLKACASRFITSSCPVITIEENYNSRKTEKQIKMVSFPLSPKILVFCSDDPQMQVLSNKFFYAGEDFVFSVNALYEKMSMEETRFLVADSKNCLEPLIQNRHGSK